MADTLIGLADKKPRLPEQWGKLMFPA
jgi:hypothetical protein